jgi:predicted DNA-binding transcriptional regulator YafY
MGVPLELHPTDAWEVEHGYVIPAEDYELEDPGFTDEERAALWLAAQVVRLGGRPTGPEGLLKLGGAPVTGAGEPLAADLGVGVDDLAVAFRAIADRRILEFEYRSRSRSVQPLALIHRRGHWYLMAVERGQERAYRVDRGSGYRAGEKEDAFKRPAGFDAKSAIPEMPWEAGTDEPETAVVRFDPDVAWWAERQLPGGAVRRLDDGSLEATLGVANRDSLVGWLITFGASAEIVSPPALRDRLVTLVQGGS